MYCSPEWTPALPALRHVVWWYASADPCSTKPPPHQRLCLSQWRWPQSCPWTRRSGVLDSTEAGLTSDGADARRARFGPNVLTSYRVTALGVLTRQLRNLARGPFPWAIEEADNRTLLSAGRRRHKRPTPSPTGSSQLRTRRVRLRNGSGAVLLMLRRQATCPVRPAFRQELQEPTP